MSKKKQSDPAFLFYPNDFIGGTVLFSYEQRGQYITLLCIQHSKGFITENDFKKIVNVKKMSEIDSDLLDKFIKNKDGTFFNKKLSNVMEKRQKYSESRSKNRLSKVVKNESGNGKKDMFNICQTYDEHTININENINTNEIKDIKDSTKHTTTSTNKGPSLSDVRQYAESRESSVDPFKFYEFYSELNWVDTKGNEVKNWKNKFVQWEKKEFDKDDIRTEHEKIPKKTNGYDFSRTEV